MVAVWMGSPPEVHSAALSAGPGPGGLLAAAGAWTALSAEYAATATELTTLLAETQATAWHGVGAQAHASAHQPYLAWLTRRSTDAAAAAARHETAATAYTAALAAMPTMAELAANHGTHAVLTATNFFGINTIPIALNEADYGRMWIQAATTMSAYAATAAATTDSMPPAIPAPGITTNPLQPLLDELAPILKKLGIEDGLVAHDPKVGSPFDWALSDLLKNVGINWDPTAGTLNGHVYDYYANASEPIWYLARTLELIENFQFSGANPGGSFQYLLALMLFDWPTHIAQLATTLSQAAPMLAAAALAPAGALGGLAGLAGLAGLPQPDLPIVVDGSGVPAGLPAVGSGPTVITAGAPPAPAPAPAATAPAAATPPPAPPPAGAPALAFPYVVGGGPWGGFPTGAGVGATAATGARRKTPTPEAAAAAADAAEQARRRRRRRRTRGDEADATLGATIGVDPDFDTGVSGRGAGPIGRADAMMQPGPVAAGLAALHVDEFGGGPRAPMLPETWEAR